MSRLMGTFCGARLESDVEDEIQFHMEMRTRELLAQGVSPQEARRQAGSAWKI